MNKRNVLGKGLGALIPEAKNDAGSRFRIVEISEIVSNPYQPRETFKPEELKALAENIKEKGILQPLLVQKKAEGFELIAGERRWRAAQMVGLNEVPVIIQEEITEIDSLTIALMENLHRQDLNAIEEAKAYRILTEEFGLLQEEVAHLAGKDRATIANLLRLLKLPPEVQDLVIQGELSMGHARALLALESLDTIRKAAAKVIEEGLSVRATEALVKKLLTPPKSNEDEAPPQSTHLRHLQEVLIRNFGTKVSIKSQGDKGKIVFEFYSEDELSRLLDMLVGNID